MRFKPSLWDISHHTTVVYFRFTSCLQQLLEVTPRSERQSSARRRVCCAILRTMSSSMFRAKSSTNFFSSCKVLGSHWIMCVVTTDQKLKSRQDRFGLFGGQLCRCCER